jgi:DASS family divalent anion:Na+ symporter
MHYFFVSQTAHLLALFGLFLSLGTAAGLPAPLVAYMLLLATNFFSAVTPQGSSANVLFAGSGYLTTGELYGYGALVTAVNTLIFLAVGTPWILLMF